MRLEVLCRVLGICIVSGALLGLNPLASGADADGSKPAVKVGGLVQAEGVFLLEDDRGQASRFQVRRARLSVRGSWARFSARVQAQWTPSGVTMLDAHVDVRLASWASLRAGKQKTPLGLEMLRPAAFLGLPERGLSSALVPSRDVGFSLYGAPWDGRLTYMVGVFDGAAGSMAVDGNIGDRFDLAARVFAQPFLKASARSVRGLGLGLAGSWGLEAGETGAPGLGRARTVTGDVFHRFSEDALARGQRWRVNPQAWWYWGPVGLLGEYVYSVERVRVGAVARDVLRQAWLVEASVVLTGEAASYRGVKPKRAWGAMEVVGQYSALRTDGGAFKQGLVDPSGPAAAHAGGAALRYWSPSPVMVEVAYARTDFIPGSGSGRPPEDALFIRVQAAF